MRYFTHPAYRWEPWTAPTVRDGRGPERTVHDDPDPNFKRRPVGFRPPEREPEVWEGDDA